MKRRSYQKELPCAGDVFNLVNEVADDPWRLERERWALAEAQELARQYQERMQRVFSQCPGFIGGDAPSSEKGCGRVVIEPQSVMDAVPWLKRRFHVSENLDLSADNGLVIEIKPRRRGQQQAGGRKVKVSFDKPVQFELGI